MRTISRSFWFCPNDGFQRICRQNTWKYVKSVIWAKSKKSKNRSKNHENYRILFFRPILENLGHFWWTRAILGSKNFFHRFQNRILRKYRIFEYIFWAEFTQNLASCKVRVSKNRENFKNRFFRQNLPLKSPEHDGSNLKIFPICLGSKIDF